MKKIIIILLVAFNFFPLQYAFANVGYIPEQLQQFEQTNKCEGCTLNNIDWGNHANGSTCNHDGAMLHGANLSHGSPDSGKQLLLSGADLSNVNFSCFSAEPNGVNFSRANLTNAILSNTSFRGLRVTTFSQAIIINATFSNSNLSGADFSYANLTGTSFVGADLGLANLFGAKGLDLTGVKSVCDAILPDGTKGKC